MWEEGKGKWKDMGEIGQVDNCKRKNCREIAERHYSYFIDFSKAYLKSVSTSKGNSFLGKKS